MLTYHAVCVCSSECKLCLNVHLSLFWNENMSVWMNHKQDSHPRDWMEDCCHSMAFCMFKGGGWRASLAFVIFWTERRNWWFSNALGCFFPLLVLHPDKVEANGLFIGEQISVCKAIWFYQLKWFHFHFKFTRPVHGCMSASLCSCYSVAFLRGGVRGLTHRAAAAPVHPAENNGHASLGSASSFTITLWSFLLTLFCCWLMECFRCLPASYCKAWWERPSFQWCLVDWSFAWEERQGDAGRRGCRLWIRITMATDVLFVQKPGFILRNKK